LTSAGEDDVIVIAFAGHGSPDGNLVLFDTRSSDLAGTSLSMALVCFFNDVFSFFLPIKIQFEIAGKRLGQALQDGSILKRTCRRKSVWTTALLFVPFQWLQAPRPICLSVKQAKAD
jgi:hypothetical protein